jgi:hypothetical protein
VTIVAEASDPDGSVARVEFYAQGVGLLGADMDGSDGWTLTIPNPPAGTYIVTAVAVDDLGASCSSTAITATVTDETPVCTEIAASTDEDMPVNITLIAMDDDEDLTFQISTTEVDLSAPSDAIVGTSGNTPGAEGVANAIDNNDQTKYLNFDKLNTGFTITLGRGDSIVTGLSLTSANDAPERDPASYTLEGSNDGSTFAVISSGPVPAFGARFEKQTVSFANSTPYNVYRLIFPTVANEGSANSMQIAEVELLGVPGPVHGTVSVAGNVATYMPDPNYCGPDTFAYTATDPCGNVSAACPVTIDVIGVPDAPMCMAASASTCEDVAVEITLMATDADIGSCLPEMLTFSVASQPANGMASIAGNVATYTPALNFNGADSFTFKVTDMYGLASVCTVDVTVQPGNDPPVADFVVMPTVDLGPTVPGINVMSPNNIGACVTLDGTLSSDVDTDFEDLTFSWYVDGMMVGTGPVLADVCVLVGQNEVTLVVDDNFGQPGPCDAEISVAEKTEMVTVITGMEATEELIMQINDATLLSRKNKQQFIASLKSAAASFERANWRDHTFPYGGSFGAGINKLEALINKFEAQLNEDPGMQQAWIERTTSIIEGMSMPVECEGCYEPEMP